MTLKGPQTEEHTRDRCLTPEREAHWSEPRTLKTRGRSEDHQETCRQPQGAKRSLRQRLEAHPEGTRAKHLRSCRSGNRPTHMTHKETSSRRTTVEGQKKEATRVSRSGIIPPTRPSKGGGHREGPEPPQERFRNSSFRLRNGSKTVSTQRVSTSRRISPEGKEKQTKPSFQSRIYQPRPCRGDPIAKVANPMGEENSQEPAQPEQAGEGRTGEKATNPAAKENGGRTTTGQEVNIPQTHSVSADEARRR